VPARRASRNRQIIGFVAAGQCSPRTEALARRLAEVVQRLPVHACHRHHRPHRGAGRLLLASEHSGLEIARVRASGRSGGLYISNSVNKYIANLLKRDLVATTMVVTPPFDEAEQRRAWQDQFPF